MKDKSFIGICYFYVILPVFLFFIGWAKIWLSLPLCIILIYTFYRIQNLKFDLWLPEWTLINIIKGILLLSLITVWVYFSGIGNYVVQNPDHLARNALYEAMVTHRWPVTQTIVTDGQPQTYGLIYYIGYWLPASVIGKLLGIPAGYFFQFLWAVLGVSIGTVLLNSFLKKWSVWPVLLFMLFSGLDTLGYLQIGEWNLILSFRHLEWWSGYQFSSFTTQLYWVFNQSIYAWVLMALLLSSKDNRHLILLWSCGLLECTFPFIGMLPFMFYILWRNEKETSTLRTRISKLFTIENIVGGGIIGIVTFFYLIGNRSVQESIPKNSKEFDIIMYLIFILLEAGIYYFYAWQYYQHNPLFYISLISLLLCPFIKVGHAEDFCMRASIPSLMILYFMIVQSLRNGYHAKRRLYCLSLFIILSIGSITVIHELGRSVTGTFQQYQKYGRVINQMYSEETLFQPGNFSGAAVAPAVFVIGVIPDTEPDIVYACLRKGLENILLFAVKIVIFDAAFFFDQYG